MTIRSRPELPFKVAQAHYQAMLNLFRWFDRDNDGWITLADLQQFFEEYYESNFGEDWKNRQNRLSSDDMMLMIQEINAEGRISFCDLLSAINCDIETGILELCKHNYLSKTDDDDSQQRGNKQELLLATEIHDIYSQAFKKVNLLERTADRLRCFYNFEVPVVEKVIQKELRMYQLSSP